MVARVPPTNPPTVTGTYDKTCIIWVDLPQCIVGNASVLESHERVELISPVLSKDLDAECLVQVVPLSEVYTESIILHDPRDREVGLDTAHFKMLCNLCNQTVTPSERFLVAVQSSCLAQQMADLSYHVPWSRHLVSCLCCTLGAHLHIV